MSDSLHSLYDKTLIEHGKHPRNFRPLENATCHGEADNPLCGDRIELFLKLKTGRVAEAAFQGQGCAISMAAASMMTVAIAGKEAGAISALAEAFEHLVTGDAAPDAARMGDLAAFVGVRRYPVRAKCALLPWQALRAAIGNEDTPAASE